VPGVECVSAPVIGLCAGLNDSVVLFQVLICNSRYRYITAQLWLGEHDSCVVVSLKSFVMANSH